MVTVERFEDVEAWKHARGLTKMLHGLARNGLVGGDVGQRIQSGRASVLVMDYLKDH
jgi:hypothetical protein